MEGCGEIDTSGGRRRERWRGGVELEPGDGGEDKKQSRRVGKESEEIR